MGDDASSPSQALRAFESLLTVEHGTAAKWSGLADWLRSEAAIWPEYSDQRRKRIARAEECDARAQRQLIRSLLRSAPDFVPTLPEVSL